MLFFENYLDVKMVIRETDKYLSGVMKAEGTLYHILSYSGLSLSPVMVFHIFHMKNIAMALNLLNIYATNYDHGNIPYHTLIAQILIDSSNKFLHLQWLESLLIPIFYLIFYVTIHVAQTFVVLI